MKSGVKHLLLAFALCAVFVMDAAATEELNGPPDTNSSVLVLKLNRKFIGGEVQIYDTNHSLVVSQKMKKRIMTIDFGVAMVGEYTIRVMKGNQQQEFYFLKK